MLEQAKDAGRRPKFALFINSIPDFNIDIAAEQEALSCRSDRLAAPDAVVQHSSRSSNFGSIKSSRTAGLTVTAARRYMAKHLLWAVTTGGGESHFEIGTRIRGFDVLSQPLQATAIYCGGELAATVCHALHLYLTDREPSKGAGAAL